MRTVLGIETSCDETACAIITEDKKILSHVVYSQVKDHEQFGGVVPDVAARAHLNLIKPCVEACCLEADLSLGELSAIAATSGPGLIGGVMIGATFAKGLSFGLHKPFIAINHLEAHALTVRALQDVPFPFLLLLVSGGHCQIILAQGIGQYKILGTTIDDAVGEAFDKTAKLLGLGYPGGAAMERKAQNGSAHQYKLPRPLLAEKSCNFSFSGLKTAARSLIQAQGTLQEKFICDMAASFQEAVSDILVRKLAFALSMENVRTLRVQHLVVAGGVAANQYLRQNIQTLADEHQLTFTAPDLSLCTDNGVMVAWAGMEYLQAGYKSPFNTSAKPRWPLDQLSLSSMVPL